MLKIILAKYHMAQSSTIILNNNNNNIGREISYNLMLVYKASEFLDRLQSYVRNLPLYYSEGRYPIRMELKDDGVGGIFSYNVTSTFPPNCYRCDFSNYNTKGEYDYHCVRTNPGLPAYPGPADIKEYDLTPQGMSWESI